MNNTSPWSIYDLFLDVPHPAASASAAPLLLIGPNNNSGDAAKKESSTTAAADPIEQELSKTIPQISRFAFPEYVERPDAAAQKTNDGQVPSLNRFDKKAMATLPFQNYTFSLQLQSGVRVHGHVRRYQPVHAGAKGRYDVGKRSERALVVLTRASGGDAFYASILKTMEALCSQQNVIPEKELAHEKPLHWFLHELVSKHRYLSSSAEAAKKDSKGMPVALTVSGLEFGKPKIFGQVDVSHFIIPPCLLHPPVNGNDLSSFSDSSILPLLRRLGVANALRMMSALLGERRVLLISSSPTRLAACCRAAISMLAQGMLHWHHIYIPVLPPHLWQYLAAPVPYIIGILQKFKPQLDTTDGLGEILIIDLDKNAMETRDMAATVIQKRIPDLLAAEQMQLQQQVAQLGQQPMPFSASQQLARSLDDLVKNDKKTLYGESMIANVAETTTKATKALKSQFMKFREKSTKYMKQQLSSESLESGNTEQQQQQEATSYTESEEDKMSPDHIFIETCRNEEGERDARVLFTTFFFSLYGNMRWYVSRQQGQLPQLDKRKFLEQRRGMGDSESTPMGMLLNNFVHTQMLEEFVKERVAEIQNRQPVTPDSPLFLRCGKYITDRKIDFSTLTIQRTAFQLAHNNQSGRMRYSVAVRGEAMAVTSKKQYEGDYQFALAHLVEKCRESSSVLFDVMSVIWMRMRDSKGLNWKNALHSLILLRNLLYHGPLAAISEATDGLAKIKEMKKYNDNMRSQNCQQVRDAAALVYNLLVDRSKLFAIRKLTRDSRLRLTVPFKNNHAATRPHAVSSYTVSNVNNTPTVAVLPPVTTASSSSSHYHPNPAEDPSSSSAAFRGSTSTAASSSSYSAGGADDLLGLDAFAAGSSSGVVPSQSGATASAASSNLNDDLLDIFSTMGVSSPAVATPPSYSSADNPFADDNNKATPPASSTTDNPFADGNNSSIVATTTSASPYSSSMADNPFVSPPPANNNRSREQSKSPLHFPNSAFSTSDPHSVQQQQQQQQQHRGRSVSPVSMRGGQAPNNPSAAVTVTSQDYTNISGGGPYSQQQQQQPQAQQQQNFSSPASASSAMPAVTYGRQRQSNAPYPQPYNHYPQQQPATNTATPPFQQQQQQHRPQQPYQSGAPLSSQQQQQQYYNKQQQQQLYQGAPSHQQQTFYQGGAAYQQQQQPPPYHQGGAPQSQPYQGAPSQAPPPPYQQGAYGQLQQQQHPPVQQSPNNYSNPFQ